MQQALVGAAVLAVLGLKASYPLVRVYWLENPEKTFAEIRDILQEIEDDLSRLEKQVITRILELSGTAGKGLGYRGVKELKREWHEYVVQCTHRDMMWILCMP
ncbi:hypothetical protein PsYK624_086990 [Phanerochaete sordida]|uniref:Uncharacterized protein n=1 Tax=Phanerochaete sordida TaxID=48140 RepID=A0A9P3LFE6_9APHY|nr:hypothetical protein PsYK624_086990 [Phanerochaete sordida]